MNWRGLVALPLIIGALSAHGDSALCIALDRFGPELKREATLTEMNFRENDLRRMHLIAQHYQLEAKEAQVNPDGTIASSSVRALMAKELLLKSKVVHFYLSGVGTTDTQGNPVILTGSSKRASTSEDISLAEIATWANQLQQAGAQVTLVLDVGWGPRSSGRAEFAFLTGSKFYKREGKAMITKNPLETVGANWFMAGLLGQDAPQADESNGTSGSVYLAHFAARLEAFWRMRIPITVGQMAGELHLLYRQFQSVGYLETRPQYSTKFEERLLGDIRTVPAGGVKPATVWEAPTTVLLPPPGVNLQAELEPHVQRLKKDLQGWVSFETSLERKYINRVIQLGPTAGAKTAMVLGRVDDEFFLPSKYAAKSWEDLMNQLATRLKRDALVHRLFFSPESTGARKQDLGAVVRGGASDSVFQDGDEFSFSLAKLPPGWTKCALVLFERSQEDGIIRLVAPQVELLDPMLSENQKELFCPQLQMVVFQEETVEMRAILIRVEEDFPLPYSISNLEPEAEIAWLDSAAKLLREPSTEWTWCTLKYRTKVQ